MARRPSKKAAVTQVAPLASIAELEQVLGHRFKRPELLTLALTHRSYVYDAVGSSAEEDRADPSHDNEQLEFMGDAVLGFVTTEELFKRFPSFREGELSKLRAHLVSEKHLIRVAQELELGHYLNLGRGEEKSGGRNKTALLVDALEAVLAAIYLDSGLETARRFVLQLIVTPELERQVNAAGHLAFPSLIDLRDDTDPARGLIAFGLSLIHI